MGSQRVGHDWATELNWTESKEKSPEPNKNKLEFSAFEKQNIFLSEMKRERVFEPQMWKLMPNYKYLEK